MAYSFRLLVGAVVVSMVMRATAQAQRSWDDSGNDASKEWSIFGNWDPDGTPANEPITIGNLANAMNDTTLVDQNFTIDSLLVTNGADVDTSGNELIVDGVTAITGAGVNIIVDPRTVGDFDGLDSQGISVNAGATLQVVGMVGSTAGGQVELESGLFEINTGANAGGHGTFQLISAAAGVAMENSGRLFVSGRPNNIIFQGPLPGTLTITHADLGSGTLDLDGTNEIGVVDVDDSGIIIFDSTSLTLVIEVPLTDNFGGTMNIGDGDTVNMVNAWTIDSDGILNFNGTGTHTLTGGTLTVNGAFTQVNMNGGTTVFDNALTVTDGDFTLDSGATVQFDGAATFADATDFVNANAANTEIVINAQVNIGTGGVAAGEDFNWDGGGFADNVTIVNDGGNLLINVENIDLAGDSYGGTLTLDSGSMNVQVGDNAWQMVRTLNLNNVADGVPILGGDLVEIGNDAGSLDSDLNVGGTGLSWITAPVTFKSDADVNIAAGTLLTTTNTTFQSANGVNHAEFTGGGRWEMTGINTVSETTTINMTGGTVELDNESISGPVVMANDTNVNAPLTINAASVADYGESKTVLMTTSFSDLNVDHLGAETGSLTVNLDDPNAEWTVIDVGIVNLINDNAEATLLAGSDVNMNGTLNVTGDVRSDARLDIGATGVVNIQTVGEPLRLSGGGPQPDNVNRIMGGTINGPGRLGATNLRGLHGFGTIHADIDFDQDSELFARDGTLTLTGAILDARLLGTFNAASILDVTDPWNSIAVTQVVLQGGELRGGTITNDGLLRGAAGDTLVSAQVINNLQIFADGGNLIFDTDGDDNDWDGALDSGQLNAFAGNLTLRDDAAFPYLGTIFIDNGHEVFADGFALNLEAGSLLDLTSGAFKSTEATRIGGTVIVHGGGASTISVPDIVVFESGSSTSLNDDLQLENANTVVVAGATFAGGGNLVNLDGSQLTLIDGSDVGVLIENLGELEIDGLFVGTAGRADADDLQQSTIGQLHIDVRGTGLSSFDRLVLSGGAQLDGTLELALGGSYVPALGNPLLTIISAAGGVTGSFASVIQPVGMPAGLMFDVIYGPTLVQLMVVSQLAGDYNQNGVVDAADYTVWQDTLGAMVTAFSGADGDGDGTVDSGDYDVWKMNVGNSAPGAGAGAGSLAAVPEPATFVYLLAVVAAVAYGLQRR